MKYKITKTDRRHNGYNIMKYIVEADWELSDSKDDRIRWLKDMRVWLWENFGPGSELKYTTINLGTTSTPRKKTPGEPDIPTVERWAWDTEFNHNRLYLKSDAELTFFTLKFTS